MSRPAFIPALVALFALPLAAVGQGAVLPGLEQVQPQGASAPMLALWAVAPYAELWQAGLPLPPSPAECEALPARQFQQEQLAMKRVWLMRVLRARAERNRVSRQNWRGCAAQAREWGAPAVFAELLERRASDSLSRAQCYLVETALDHMLALYRVDALEIRYFVESSALPPDMAEADWFPLSLLFNTVPPAGLSSEAVGAHDLALLSALSELALLYSSVQDAASADAAAAAMPPLLARFRSASRALGYAPDELRLHVRSRYAALAGRAEGAWLAQRRRVAEADYFGSARLRALDFFMD